MRRYDSIRYSRCVFTCYGRHLILTPQHTTKCGKLRGSPRIQDLKHGPSTRPNVGLCTEYLAGTFLLKIIGTTLAKMMQKGILLAKTFHAKHIPLRLGRNEHLRNAPTGGKYVRNKEAEEEVPSRGRDQASLVSHTKEVEGGQCGAGNRLQARRPS
jgi:hypothetical protein